LGASLGELATRFGCELHGEPDARVERVATLGNAVRGCLSFFANPAYRELLRHTQASVVVLQAADVADCPRSSPRDSTPSPGRMPPFLAPLKTRRSASG